MDLFGFKKRRAERDRAARRNAEDRQAARTMRGLAHTSPLAAEQPRRRRPEAGAPEGLYGGGLYPHSSSSGMATDMNYASYASAPEAPPAPSSHDSLGAAGSGAFGDSGSGGYTNSGSGYTNTDSGYSSGSSSYDSGSSSSFSSD